MRKSLNLNFFVVSPHNCLSDFIFYFGDTVPCDTCLNCLNVLAQMSHVKGCLCAMAYAMQLYSCWCLKDSRAYVTLEMILIRMDNLTSSQIIFKEKCGWTHSASERPFIGMTFQMSRQTLTFFAAHKSNWNDLLTLWVRKFHLKVLVCNDRYGADDIFEWE